MNNNENSIEIKKKKRNSNRPLPPAVKILFLYVLPLIFVAALVCVCIWGSKQKALAENYKTETETLKSAAGGMYEEAFTELVSSVYNIHIDLSKLLVSEAPSTITSTLNEIQRESGLCAGLMGHIPQSHAENRELNGFLIRIGDYAAFLSKSVMRDTPISDGDRKQLISLYEASEKIYAELLYKLENNEFPKEGITTEEFFLLNSEENSESAEAVKEFPTLIYDGPFSESAEKLKPRGVAGEPISEAEALLKAKQFIGDENAVLTLASVSNGKIPSYDFEGTLTSGEPVDIGITAQGGQLIFMKTNASGGLEGLPSESEKFELAQKGKSWLAHIGYAGMKPVAAQYYSGSALINYAAVQNGIIIYNDLVKVWLDRATGEIIGADARNYLFSHIQREFPETLLDIREVQSLLSPVLSVKETQLALIPITPQTEILCYEFKCGYGNAEYAVYLDAKTGEEIEILRIIKDENGERVI